MKSSATVWQDSLASSQPLENGGCIVHKQPSQSASSPELFVAINTLLIIKKDNISEVISQGTNVLFFACEFFMEEVPGKQEGGMLGKLRWL